MAVGGRPRVDRTLEVEGLVDLGRAQVEDLPMAADEQSSPTVPVPKVSTRTESGLATPMA
jgi:hypothetical protein